jgi:hypothetical protein
MPNGGCGNVNGEELCEVPALEALFAKLSAKLSAKLCEAFCENLCEVLCEKHSEELLDLEEPCGESWGKLCGESVQLCGKQCEELLDFEELCGKLCGESAKLSWKH